MLAGRRCCDCLEDRTMIRFLRLYSPSCPLHSSWIKTRSVLQWRMNPPAAQPGRHKSATNDCHYVLDDDVCLSVTMGPLASWNQGDSVIQNGTCHTWRDQIYEFCRIICALIGAHHHMGSDLMAKPLGPLGHASLFDPQRKRGGHRGTPERHRGLWSHLENRQ
jgi:hypothetical protein